MSNVVSTPQQMLDLENEKVSLYWAARASRFPIRFDLETRLFMENIGCRLFGPSEEVVWDPRKDDGQALRLLLILGMSLDHRLLEVGVFMRESALPAVTTAPGAHPFEKVRNAIVELAAKEGLARYGRAALSTTPESKP